MALNRYDSAVARPFRAAVFALVAAVHVAILLLAVHRVGMRVVHEATSVVFLLPPSRAPAAPDNSAKHTISEESLAPETPAPPIPPPVAAEKPPATIDWAAEAKGAAGHQAELAAAPQPRALDQHGAGTDFNGGLGPDRARPPEFGWDRSKTHRIERLPGGGTLVRVNDQCVIILFPIPFAACALGRIPVRGDLFDHMRDAPISDSGAPNSAP
jgi:hypothetical protein